MRALTLTKNGVRAAAAVALGGLPADHRLRLRPVHPPAHPSPAPPPRHVHVLSVAVAPPPQLAPSRPDAATASVDAPEDVITLSTGTAGPDVVSSSTAVVSSPTNGGNGDGWWS